MDVTSEKIDAIRRRAKAAYRRAKESSEETGALQDLKGDRRKAEILKVKGEDLMKTLSGLVKRGNASRIIVRNESCVVAEIPVTIGVMSVVLAPWVTLFTTAALLMSPWTIEVERP